MTGLIPQPFIDELLIRTDIVELIDGLLPLKKQGNHFVACCPFHQENTPSFHVNSRKQFYYCFGCGVSGNVISFVMQYHKQNFVDAVEFLAIRIGWAVPRDGKHPEQRKHTESLFQLLARVTQFFQQQLNQQSSAGKAYLVKRGIRGDVIKQFQLGYSLPAWHALQAAIRDCLDGLQVTGMLVKGQNNTCYDRYRHRLMFPIHDVRGHVIGFGGRAIDSQQTPKYLNSPETMIFQKSRELYGLHQAIQTTPIQSIVVVEGYLDVISLVQHGLVHVVATLGTATSTYHIQRLKKYTQKILFCFDGDQAGRRAAWGALENCLAHMGGDLDVRFVFLPEGQDPDSFVRTTGIQAFRECLQMAMPLHEFLLTTLSHEKDINSLPGRSQLFHAADPLVKQVPDGAYKQLLLDELTRLTHIDPQQVTRLINANVHPMPSKESDNKQQTQIKKTPESKVIAILLQHPEIYQQHQEQIDCILQSETIHPLLEDVLSMMKQKKPVNTAQCIEAFRNHSCDAEIMRLSAWEHAIPQAQLTNELLETLQFIAQTKTSEKIEQAIQKARKEGLNDDERKRLLDLLQQRQKIKSRAFLR